MRCFVPFRLYATCLWPGLSRLWLLGDITALGIAVVFALLLNGMLAVTWMWPGVARTEPSGWLIPILGWTLVLCFWGGSFWHAVQELTSLHRATARTADAALFCEAQLEYLKGDWVECERHLNQLLKRTPRDIEARLLLATTQRQAQRYDDARRELDCLEKIDGSQRWWWEIRDERARIVRLLDSDAQPSPLEAVA